MKTVLPIFFALLTVVGCSTKQSVPTDKMVLPEEGQVGVYYFRTSIRCETCDVIEKIISEELNGNYAEKIENGDVVFRQFNLDDQKVADFALQFDVVFKSLIILKDQQQTNLTEEAFLYALPKPDKFRELFEKSID